MTELDLFFRYQNTKIKLKYKYINQLKVWKKQDNFLTSLLKFDKI